MEFQIKETGKIKILPPPPARVDIIIHMFFFWNYQEYRCTRPASHTFFQIPLLIMANG